MAMHRGCTKHGCAQCMPLYAHPYALVYIITHHPLSPHTSHHTTGPSEWRYAWIPVVAPLCGGLAGAGLFAAIREMYHGQVNPQALIALQASG